MSFSGRPKNLSPTGKKFLDLYLDPLLDVDSICKISNISRSTFYNYENELNLPKLRVGLGTVSKLTSLRAFNNLQDPGEKYELQLIRQIGKLMGVRIKLVPFFSGVNSAVSAVCKQEVDFALSSLSWTKERSKALYFSEPYYQGSPWGHLIQMKILDGLSLKGKKKPTLGVFYPSVHHEYAAEFLAQEFEIKCYSSVPSTIKALTDGNADFILANSNVFTLYPNETMSMKIASPKILYKSHTGIIFHADSEHWRKAVNTALGRVGILD